jgi:hypothetical protein
MVISTYACKECRKEYNSFSEASICERRKVPHSLNLPTALTFSSQRIEDNVTMGWFYPRTQGTAYLTRKELNCGEEESHYWSYNGFILHGNFIYEDDFEEISTRIDVSRKEIKIIWMSGERKQIELIKVINKAELEALEDDKLKKRLFGN